MASYRWVKSVSSIIVSLFATSAMTADITIANGQEVMTTQSSTANGDVIIIQPNGKITAIGVDGVSVTHNDVIVNNQGLITTTGGISQGIVTTGVRTFATNSGTISTTGTNADAILFFGGTATDGQIINNGSIITIGNNADGIIATDPRVTIINNGTISAGLDGIRTGGDDINITNTGSITGAGGIVANGDNTVVTNTGSVVATANNANAIGINGTNSTVINNGSVSVTGNNSRAVDLNSAGAANITFSNTGLVSATTVGSTAIAGGTGAQTVNLGEGSKILGIIDLGGGTDTVNILGVSPSANLTLVGVEAVNISTGIAAIATGTSNVVTVDPTGDAVRATSLSIMTSGVHQLITRRARSNKQLKPVQLASLELTPGMLYQERGPLAWTEVFGSRRKRKTDYNVAGHNHSFGGIVGGYERDFHRARLGLLAGYANSDIETEVASIDTDTHSYFAGGYGHFHLGGINLTTVLMAGYERHDNDRLVFDNLLGIQNASSEFDSFFFSPSITLSSAIPLSDNYEFRPSASLAYTVSWYESYQESGTTASNLVIDERMAHALNSQLQLAAAYTGLENSDVELRFGAKSRHIDEDDIEATLAGTNFNYSSADDENDYGAFIGANVKVAVQDRLHLVTDLEYLFMDGDEDEKQISGSLSLDYLF